MLNIFISHAKEDREYAKQLAQKFRYAGHEVWIDAYNIQGGQDWEEEIFNGIEQAEVVVVCLSPASINSQWVRREIFLARAQHKTVLPIMLVECISLLNKYEETRGLSRFQVINFEGRHDQAIQESLSALRRIQYPHQPAPSFLYQKWDKLSLVLIIISWIFALFIASFSSRVAFSFSGNIPDGIFGAVCGLIGGVGTALVLRRLQPSLKWQQIATIIASWIVSEVVIWNVSKGLFITSNFFTIGMASAVGGLVTGLVLRGVKSSIKLLWILVITVSWVASWIVAILAIQILILGDWRSLPYGVGEIAFSIVLGIVAGSIVGSIGGGVTLWISKRSEVVL